MQGREKKGKEKEREWGENENEIGRVGECEGKRQEAREGRTKY
jgi:hypothetical protein